MTNKEQLSMPRCDIEELKEAIEKLEKENCQLKRAIDYLGGRKCPKCGEYHHQHFICWNCGYDYTAPEVLK